MHEYTPGMKHPLNEHATMGQANVPEIEPQHLDAHRESVRIIDVREPHEYNAELGHIAGSELVPLSGVVQASATWDRNEPFVMVCRSGGRSGQATQALIDGGFTQVLNLKGGMLAWNEAGLETAIE